MDHFNYRGDALYAEDIPVRELAQRFGTPCYVYSRATLERHWHAFDRALAARPHLVCFAVKANSNLGVLNLLARLGSGFDIVSVGELERVLAAGGAPERIIFSGVGKREDEIRRALDVGIRCFNVESEPELARIAAVAAAQGVIAPVSLRVNPDVDARSHPYISTGLKQNKFGIDIHDALDVYRRAAAMDHVHVAGIDCHIGSQLTDLAPFLDALDRVLALADRLAAEGIHIEHLDLGGGLGIRYTDEVPPEPAAYAEALNGRLGERALEVVLEPGRAIAGNAGILLTRVEYLKPTATHNFAIVDAAMNDLLRPALYQAVQEIVPAVRRAGAARAWDIVGPVCETGDFLGKGRELVLAAGDLLAVRASGAYGFTMSSNYNTRPRAAEVIVDGAEAHLVRRRETIAELYAGEALLP
ncbi:diaminopimelate decarboxylase [Thiohalocapsa sp. ML1]|uniref:diaminopimelate decarboxylase n=1 Tax=Thiohalocapsa sp. ML1 TaxID=1431688 RepID=UPI000731F5F3|nr:diaminopimelate decarboxylase [Thiohalocapsa sp. ML1]